MKAKLYILTYKNEGHLNSGLEHLFRSDLSQHQLDIFIVNNHTDFRLHEEFKPKVTVLHNVMQPDFGFGHPPRNWNQSLILGFKRLTMPDCDLVILAHDDCHYQFNWLNLLHKAHFEMGYHFVACGSGDMLHSYTPTAVKKVGMWDERFGSLCFYEHDYFIRCAMYLGDAASVNDTGHQGGSLYELNRLPFAQQIGINPERNEDQNILVPERCRWENPFRELFKEKWGNYSEFTPVRQFKNSPRLPGIRGYVYYPYFERDVEDLVGKGFNLEHGWLYPWQS